MSQLLAVEVSDWRAIYLSQTEQYRVHRPLSAIDFVIPHHVDPFMRAAIKAFLRDNTGVYVIDGDRPLYQWWQEPLLMDLIAFLSLFAVLEYIFQNVSGRVFTLIICYATLWYFKADFTTKITCALIVLKLVCVRVKKAFALIFHGVATLYMFDGWSRGVDFHQPYVFSRIIILTLLMLFCISKMLY